MEGHTKVSFGIYKAHRRPKNHKTLINKHFIISLKDCMRNLKSLLCHYLFTIAGVYQIICSSSMVLGVIYHEEAVLMSLHHTHKPSTFKQISLKCSEIHLDYSLYSATISDLFCGCVKITHDATIIHGLTLINPACAKNAIPWTT